MYMALPNSKGWGNKIKTIIRKIRQIDLTYRIHRDENIGQAMQIIQDITDENERVLAEPELIIAVRNLSESSIYILFRRLNNGEFTRRNPNSQKGKDGKDEQACINMLSGLVDSNF